MHAWDVNKFQSKADEWTKSHLHMKAAMEGAKYNVEQYQKEPQDEFVTQRTLYNTKHNK